MTIIPNCDAKVVTCFIAVWMFATTIGELVSRYNKPKVPNKLTRLEACKHLRISETKFNMLRRKGLISEGTKKAGDVRKWSIEELDKYIKENS